MKSRSFLAALLLASVTTGAANAAYSPALDFTAVSGVNSGPTQSLGFDFKVNQAGTVNQLGVFQATTTSVAGMTVYLYDLTTNTLLASATLATGSIQNRYNYQSLAAPVALNTTDTYSVYSVFAASNSQYAVGTGIAPSSDVTVVPIQGANTGFIQGTTPTPPTFAFPNILSTNFQFQPAAVPEPASLVMLGMGLVAAGAAARRSRRVA